MNLRIATLLLLLVGFPALSGCDDDAENDSCDVLFGSPGGSTGLDGSQCQPSCECGGLSFTPPEYNATDVEDLRRMVLTNPPEVLGADPYETPEDFPERPDEVCALAADESVGNGYQLQTFDDDASALAAGAEITHYGACGQCSTLQDLSVYIAETDLTDPVRSCAVQGLDGDDEAAISCIEDLGFTEPCAEIWFYNTRNTRLSCLDVCISQLRNGDPNHMPNGMLNPCIQCDEDESGPVFKAVSGRTRRNSGLPSRICRPCDSVSPVIHRYSFSTQSANE